jgi:cbb3-type cytochrome c oxidase subunit III
MMVELGRGVFNGTGGCITCHGPGAGGALGPDLTDEDWWHAKGSYLAIMNRILEGVPREESATGTDMPPRGGAPLNEEQVQAVAAYVWTLSHPESADSLPLGVTRDLVVEGDLVFHGIGGCVTCHGEDATGVIGPNLTDDQWLHAKGSYLAIVQTVLTGVPHEQSKSGVIMPPRGGSEISDQQVYQVAAYVWALSQQAGH